MTLATATVQRSARHNVSTAQDYNQLGVVLTTASLKNSTTNDRGAEVGGHGNLMLDLMVTAHAGTNPTLDVTIEHSDDDGATDPYVTLDTFAQQTTADATTRKSFPGARAFVRASWAIGGTSTPTFTFSISGVAR